MLSSGCGWALLLLLRGDYENREKEF